MRDTRERDHVNVLYDRDKSMASPGVADNDGHAFYTDFEESRSGVLSCSDIERQNAPVPLSIKGGAARQATTANVSE